MSRAYYASHIEQFINDSPSYILGELSAFHSFSLDELQRNAWIKQIEICKTIAPALLSAYIAFEFSIPRMGKRVDVILLHQGIIFVLEFKVGDKHYINSALTQALDYALDLKNFHEQSHSRYIVPILVATEAPNFYNNIDRYDDKVYSPLRANKENLLAIINEVTRSISAANLVSEIWMDSTYKPTPTIIEAAQALYKGHSVAEISRSDSGAINLSLTSKAISEIIDCSKLNNRKSICFITGVPGAGKTLAGLNIANERHNIDAGEHAVFLSGNGPLVAVLQEALARNEVAEGKRTNSKISKKEALSKTKAFIQNIHHFRDDALQHFLPPVERVAVFDEAQRAWTLEQTTSFMKRKKGISDFDMSEPEFLISVMDRHRDWSIIICLIGGGQEINTGEAGLSEWFHAIKKDYSHWDVYVSNKLTDSEYTNGQNIYSDFREGQINIRDELHLAVSMRSFRSEKLSMFVKAILDCQLEDANRILDNLNPLYPIVLTRDLNTAKHWLKSKARGSESMGIIASSGAYRLKPYGIHIKSEIDPIQWFLNPDDDVRSSNFLEDVATEFDIQGLELDWTCVAWDANLRKTATGWSYKKFSGTKWSNINDETRKRYLLNTYRVLLTRARQGMVIFVPKGDQSDETRLPEFYDSIYNYFSYVGIPTI
ncbi:TPA: DUF2075 domain-containing protein [Legionella pneumophila]|nr:DUF2075 domain-containing protein [Legionella pneumophila]HAU0695699.1 DUF2075 domain-containing protein [Legionella pneumophila]HAU0873993.1 DUF2075 domain-containing protein [Legionella pneumophila]HDO7798033.1 DUF2075 domain-containing protein [Legionella pneumophila]HDO7970537.1 DUF2075 domain-containing protein [Legionella pneumophila]